ncbi:uncharacterized protein LOC135962054 [Calliphora vicina]|uniref:uncharacterized protein LOC135962054 n=1 Tax=Calliphora vicina TaxID=7373 RepID=UPI00325AFB97
MVSDSETNFIPCCNNRISDTKQIMSVSSLSQSSDDNSGCVATSTDNSFNIVIFNWVENYDDQIEALKVAMATLQNKVKIYNHLSEQELVKVVDSLTHTSFDLYKYIAIIILDNKCEYEQFIQTSDKKNVLLYSEIITKIETNPSLYNTRRLFVIQKLLDVRDMDDKELNKISEMINKRKMEMETQTQTPKSKTLNFGLSITIRANEMNENFKESPFLQVFSQKFQEQAETVEITKIANAIRKEIKEIRRYNIDIVTGSNEFSNSELIFGQGISPEVLRDFY